MTGCGPPGYSSYHWAENIGCRYYNDPRDAAVGLVRFFQSEKFWSPVGGHYVNMMNRAYDRAGVGLWVSGGNLNFVVNFYRAVSPASGPRRCADMGPRPGARTRLLRSGRHPDPLAGAPVTAGLARSTRPHDLHR